MFYLIITREAGGNAYSKNKRRGKNSNWIAWSKFTFWTFFLVLAVRLYNHQNWSVCWCCCCCLCCWYPSSALYLAYFISSFWFVVSIVCPPLTLSSPTISRLRFFSTCLSHQTTHVLEIDETDYLCSLRREFRCENRGTQASLTRNLRQEAANDDDARTYFLRQQKKKMEDKSRACRNSAIVLIKGFYKCK